MNFILLLVGWRRFLVFFFFFLPDYASKLDKRKGREGDTWLNISIIEDNI